MENNPVKFGRGFFVEDSDSPILLNYEVLEKLGNGGYAKVYRVKNKKTGEIRACKQLSKLDIVNLEKFQREMEILKKIDHPNIIKLYEIYQSKNHYYLVMEECKGGELFDKIIEHTDEGEMYSEKEAAEIILQVMSAVEYCHNNGICHRDLKPENILFLKKGDEKNNPIKIIDFGLSRELKSKKNLSSKVGTAYYVSPEILAGHYTEKCDIWSSGVILYVLLSGVPPFNGVNDQIIYSKIRKMKFSFPPSEWKNISEEAKDLISHMLTPENERYSANQVMEHPWFKIVKEKKFEKLNFNSQYFKEYNKSNQLKKLVFYYIASRLGEKEITHLRDAFKTFDKNNDGQISYNEFKEGLEKFTSANLNENDIKSYFSSIDTDKNDKIDYTEFLTATIEKNILLKEERLFEAFSMLDKDNNGKITKDELMKVLKLEKSDDKFVIELIKKVDKNNDGEIDYKEFLEFMRMEN